MDAQWVSEQGRNHRDALGCNEKFVKGNEELHGIQAAFESTQGQIRNRLDGNGIWHRVQIIAA